jgi:Tfp pilus assembly protein PilN
MLKVNLLPEGARKATLSPIEQLHRTPLMWILVGAMAAVPIALLVPLGLRFQRVKQLNARIQELQPKKLQIDRIQQMLRQLQQQEAEFRGLRDGRSLWSKRLNILSDVTPDGVWFTELALDPAKGLSVHGSAIGQGGSEMVHVGRLVSDLKASPDFASAVKDIQIESIKRVQDREIEIVQFTLTCALVEPAKPN